MDGPGHFRKMEELIVSVNELMAELGTDPRVDDPALVANALAPALALAQVHATAALVAATAMAMHTDKPRTAWADAFAGRPPASHPARCQSVPHGWDPNSDTQCTLDQGHSGDHTSRFGGHWVNESTPQP